MTTTPNSVQAPSDVAPAGPAPTAYLRLEGPLKVTGRTRYAGDLQPDAIGERPDVAVAVTSSRATGRISGIDVRAALAVPGVRLVMTHENAPRLHKVTSLDGAEIGDLLPLQDDRLHYNGQCVAVVVGETPEAARDGARRVAVRYSDPPPDTPAHERPAAYTLAGGAGRAEQVKKVGSGEPGHEAVVRSQ